MIVLTVSTAVSFANDLGSDCARAIVNAQQACRADAMNSTLGRFTKTTTTPVFRIDVATVRTESNVRLDKSQTREYASRRYWFDVTSLVQDFIRNQTTTRSRQNSRFLPTIIIPILDSVA